MSVVKQTRIQQHFFMQSKKDIDVSLSANSRQLESGSRSPLVDYTPKSSHREVEIAHCAVLGYN